MIFIECNAGDLDFSGVILAGNHHRTGLVHGSVGGFHRYHGRSVFQSGDFAVFHLSDGRVGHGPDKCGLIGVRRSGHNAQLLSTSDLQRDRALGQLQSGDPGFLRAGL